MANRCYLYSLSGCSDVDGIKITGLSESEYNIPLIYRILASVNPIASKSVVFDSEEKIAITADYAGGVQKLSEYFSRLPEKYRNKADKVLSFLRDEKRWRVWPSRTRWGMLDEYSFLHTIY